MTVRKTNCEVFLISAVLGFLLGTVVYLAYIHAYTPPSREQHLPKVLSAGELDEIASAIAQYRAAHGVRPFTLGELEGVLGGSYRTDGFPEAWDVLYFPGVQNDDPPDLVLLCSVVVPNSTGGYHVVLNDGRRKDVVPAELVGALNRTYTFLASKPRVRKIVKGGG